MNGKELIGKCLYCKKFTDENKQVIDDILDIVDLEEKIRKDIAIISHSVCVGCIKLLEADMCHDDSFQILDNNKNK